MIKVQYQLIFLPLAIHGDKQQNERDWVLDQFKTGKSPIMVATDVASRGIGKYQSPSPSLSSNFQQKHLLYTLLSRVGAIFIVRNCLTRRYPYGSHYVVES